MKITDLEPGLIWECFDEITKVPRPTHHLDKMREFLIDWAKRHGIEAHCDSVGNVMMKKAATPGHENAPDVAGVLMAMMSRECASGHTSRSSGYGCRKASRCGT